MGFWRWNYFHSAKPGTFLCGLRLLYRLPDHYQSVRYRFDLSDGGQVLVEYVDNPTAKGLVVIIPGLTGSSDEIYVKNMVEAVLYQGYSVYVVNH